MPKHYLFSENVWLIV